MSREPEKWPGWQIDPDPLTVEPPADPPPRKRGTGCAWLAAALTLGLLIVASSVVAAPRTAGHVIPAADRLLPPRDDGWSVSGNLDRLSGAPDHGVGVSPVTLTGAPQAVVRQGTWAYANRSHGSRYLAIPEGPGWNVTVCGPLGCLDRVSTDAGPELWLQRAGRIGDLAAIMFEEICGPLSPGLCSGSYTITGRADQHPEDPPEHPDDARMRLEDQPLPATSTEDVP